MVPRLIRSRFMSPLPRPVVTEAPCGIHPERELERKPCRQQTRRYDSPALEQQLRLGSVNERRDLENPSRRGNRYRQTATRVANDTQEICIGDRIRCREVDHSVDLIMLDEPLDGANEVAVVDPG